MAAIFENFALAAERLSDCRGSHSDPRRSAQVFMHNKPRRAEPRRLIRPDANEIGASVSEKTGEFSNADAIGRGLQLDERIVATQCDSCAFQRLIHEKRTCCCRSACESYEMVARQSLAALRHPVLGNITGRCIKRIADLAKLPTHQPGAAWT